MTQELSYLGEGHIPPYRLAAPNQKYLVIFRTVKDAAVPRTHPLSSAPLMDYDTLQ